MDGYHFDDFPMTLDESDQLTDPDNGSDHDSGYDETQAENKELRPTEVTEEMAEAGADIQGIPWHSWNHVTRSEHRLKRIRDYEILNYDLHDARKDQETVSLIRQQIATDFYKFRYTKLNEEKCYYVHFQLRNLCWATSKNDVFYICEGSNVVRQWSPHKRTSRSVIDLSASMDVFMNPIKLSTMTCRNDLLLAGGYYGEYALRRLESYDGKLYQGNITTHPNGITNHMDIVENRSGAVKTTISSNDDRSRLMDMETLKFDLTITFPWAVNCTALSPDRRLLCAVGDAPETMIVSADSGEVLNTVKGHIDFSFACTWSPDGRMLCTGNQDKTTRVYDTRNFSKPIAVLPANMGSIRSLRFTKDGRFLAMAEPADFVHIFDTQTFEQSQTIDFFGEIGGFSFSPDGETLFITNCDEDYGSILEYDRITHPLSLVNAWL